MTLSFELRNRDSGPGRVEVHRQQIGRLGHVHVIAFSPRRCEASVGLTQAQAVEMALAVLSTLEGPSLAAVGPRIEAIVLAAEACAAGALGKNTDTDSHPSASVERGGDCRLSAPLGVGVLCG